MQESKKLLRLKSLVKRDNIPNRTNKSQKIAKKLFELDEWIKSDTIASYLSVRSEVITTEIIKNSLKLNKTLIVPWANPGKQLSLCIIHSVSELSPGKFGVLEPVSELRENPERIPDTEKISLAIIPGVAFDQNRNRLGYGKGYFDKLIPHFLPKCLKVGLAFESQIYSTIPTEEHDRKVDIIITENRIIY